MATKTMNDLLITFVQDVYYAEGAYARPRNAISCKIAGPARLPDLVC